MKNDRKPRMNGKNIDAVDFIEIFSFEIKYIETIKETAYDTVVLSGTLDIPSLLFPTKRIDKKIFKATEILIENKDAFILPIASSPVLSTVITGKRKAAADNKTSSGAPIEADLASKSRSNISNG